MSGGPTRIAVLVSGGGTNLQALIDARDADALGGGTLVAVLSSKEGAGAGARAARAGIPYEVLPRSAFSDSGAMTRALTGRLLALEIDLVVLAGFLHILTPELIRAFPNRVLNVHPALIPAFSGVGCYGLRVHMAALECGVKVTGATVHFVTEEPDAGPIVLQQAVPVLEGDTPETLQRRVMEQAEWRILPRAVALFCQGRLAVSGKTVTITGGAL